VAPEQAIRGFHGATLTVCNAAPSAALLTEGIGFHQPWSPRRAPVPASPPPSRAPGAYVDLLANPQRPLRQEAAGTVHHIAWRVPNDTAELAWRADLGARGLNVTEVRDRQYFRSIYYREPGGILYEIATDPPGFTADETAAELGHRPQAAALVGEQARRY